MAYTHISQPCQLPENLHYGIVVSRDVAEFPHPKQRAQRTSSSCPVDKVLQAIIGNSLKDGQLVKS